MELCNSHWKKEFDIKYYTGEMRMPTHGVSMNIDINPDNGRNFSHNVKM
jgi:hypothetical protein